MNNTKNVRNFDNPNEKKVTIGIPAYKAHNHIKDCLSSIQIQSVRNQISIIIASDDPNDDYEYLKKKYNDLDITTLSCEKNTGPGLARQRCIDACKTDWITFIDADDVFYTPFSLEMLIRGIQPNVIEVQGIFMQEVEDNPQGMKFVPRNDVGHPWVFGRLYNVPFLKANDIKFNELRAINF